MDATVERYLEAAVRFVARPGRDVRLRVASTPLTCEVAVALLNRARLPPEPPTAYRCVNVHNPDCPVAYDPHLQRWHCAERLARHPLHCISWSGAQWICRQLGARLPHAWEWECFASNDAPARIYPWGDAPPGAERANYDEHYGGTTECGRFPASETGLFDLAGNVGEWCLDRYADGTPFERVVKGGAWSKPAPYLAIRASRGKWARLGTTTIGLRPVWDDR